jgi:DNA-directed RNA polymerase specialized sigma24 family protein
MDPAAVSERSDEELLRAAGAEPEAFAVFYRRHVRALSAYFWRRTRDAETTADLTAETFAAALDGCARFDPARGPAIGWLYGIAHRQLGTLARRGAVERRARRRLGMARLGACRKSPRGRMRLIRGCGSPPNSSPMQPASASKLCGAHNHG